jgi:hypothetical protein
MGKEVKIFILMVLVLITGALNRVAAKIMVTPFGSQYAAFTGILSAFMWV